MATQYKQYKEVTLVEMACRQEKRKNKFKEMLSTFGFLGPYGICFALFFLFPLVLGIVIAFTKYSKTGGLFPSSFVGFDNFIAVFQQKGSARYFWSSVRNTLVFSAIIVPLSIIIPLGLALLINIKPPGYKFFRAAIYLPGIFPLTATGMILLNMFAKENGFINSLFGSTIDWFGSPQTAWFMIGLFCLWCGIGGNFIILCAGLENVDKTLYEAADMDGCGAFHKFFHVTLPGIKSQLFLTIFTTLTGYMNLYGQILILAEHTTEGNESSMYSAVYTIQEALLAGKTSYGFAAAMGILLAFIIIFIAIIQMYVSRDKKGGHKHGDKFNATIRSQSK